MADLLSNLLNQTKAPLSATTLSQPSVSTTMVSQPSASQPSVSHPPVNATTLSQPSALSFLADDVARAVVTAKHVGPTPAPAGARFSTIYAFGDSLTDAGNVSLATAGLVPVSPPYAGREFSNGPVWVQDLAQKIGLPPPQPSLAGGTDFAYGGAQTGQTPNHALNPTDFLSQIGQFNTQVSSPQPNALYAVWIGSNDVLDIANNGALSTPQQQADVQAAVNNETAGIQALAARGAKDFLVLNVPDLGKAPAERGNPAEAQAASSLSTLYDNELATAIHGLEASGQLKVDLVDTSALLAQAVSNPGAFGFSNVTDPAWTGNLSSSHSGNLAPDASSHLFFDGLHPTAAAHALLATDIASTVGSLA